jgi:hypothetical protein
MVGLFGNKHLTILMVEYILGGTPLRKNYAGIGYTYDEDRDAFIPPNLSIVGY